MSHDDAHWSSTDLHDSQIRAARAQVEAARKRGQRAPAPDETLPSLPRYTILRELHRGGQGVVYLAEQDSTGRLVAVKVLSRGPVTGSPEGLARFEREVESLSLLKHPNIVAIHDCGRDHEHVFLVMNFIDGRPLDSLAGKRPVRELLEVFAKICDGVFAAHLRGIIHRDLKPGNILVDASGEPHILDFGLAKLTAPVDRAPDKIVVTEAGRFVGSLPWASPEQAEGRGDAIDVRSDVYSLGVVLYQLLTGGFPYPVHGAMADVVRHIAHTQPARPSRRGVHIDRDIETILGKCLAKEPERRYQSAGELGRDVRRYLAGKPIEARADSLVYVMSRQLARYKAAAIACAAVLVVVIAALAVSLTLWREAARSAAIAQRSEAASKAVARRAAEESEQSRAVLEFMREILAGVQPERGGAEVRLMTVLAGATAKASERFAQHPLREAEVRDLLGQSYFQLGMWPQAESEFARASDLWASAVGRDDPRTVRSRLMRVRVFLNTGEGHRAEAMLEELKPLVIAVFGPESPEDLDVRRISAIVHVLRGRIGDAEEILRELRPHPGMTGDAAQVSLIRVLLAVHTRRLASAPERREEILAQAEPLALEWMERAERLSGPGSLEAVQAATKWAELACRMGQFEEAAAVCRRVLESSAERLGECHMLRNDAMVTLAKAAAGAGEVGEPAELFLRVIECSRQTLAPSNLILLGTISESLPYLERAGRAAEGEALSRELSAALSTMGGGHGDISLLADLFLASFVSMQNRVEEADQIFGRLLAAAETADASVRVGVYIRYGQHLTRAAQYDRAEQYLKLAESMHSEMQPEPGDADAAHLASAFLALYEAWGRPGSAARFKETLPRPAR